MDPLTHGALAAAFAQPVANRTKVLTAATVGAVAGMAPDLDVLIRSSTDPLLNLEMHRHFTHSLAFSPVGALICALILYPIWRHRLTFVTGYAVSLLGYASHGVLDACTSFGTLLLWPFSDSRVAWDVVSVVDPVFTVPLLAGLVLAVLRHRPLYAAIGLAWSVCYLGFGHVQHGRAVAAAVELAESRGHAPESIVAKPSFGNTILFKTIYAHDGRYYVDAVRAGFRSRVFEGEDRRIPDPGVDFPWLDSDTQQWRDLERFRWFSGGYMAVEPGDPYRIVDVRYSLVPNRAAAFWGIELDEDAAGDAHVAYVTMRLRSTAEGREFLRMLFSQGDEGG